MLKNKFILSAAAVAFALCIRPARAQSGPASGLYQIVSGSYIECCGLAGAFRQNLPNATQSFIKLTVDPQKKLAAMTFLGADMQTVFSVVPCPAGDPIGFDFSTGLIFSNRIVFHVDPGPPPYQVYWNYAVSNSADSLRIDGMLAYSRMLCADVPNQFTHSNVVAQLVTVRPVIDQFERAGSNLRFHFSGEPPNDYFVEFTESLSATNWLCLTNYRAKLQTIEVTVTDSLTNATARFYRIRKQDCRCD